MKEFLKNMPTYEPPEAVWEAIEKRLPLLQLPTYEPSIDIWENIDNQLVKRENHLFILRGSNNKNRFLIAASFAFLIVASGILFFFRNKIAKTHLTITTETIDNQLLTQDWLESDKDFKMVEEFCKKIITPCEEPEFKNLKNELQELDKAREDIKNVLSAYNSDPDMIAQLSKIENERADILKKMIERM